MPLPVLNWLTGPSNPFLAPQGAYEPDPIYNFRAAPANVSVSNGDMASIWNSIEQSTPAGRAKKPTAASVFPQSFSDPAYDKIEQAIAVEGWKNPTIADALKKIRTLGERSNADQVSSSGAKTPYQITPSTRAGIMKQHGFDPWANPINAARGAAIALTTWTGKEADYTDPNVLAKAAGGYFFGKKGFDNPNSQEMNGAESVADYTKRLMGNLVNPYDPSMDQAAISSLAAAARHAMTPTDIFIDKGPAPEMPKPTDVPFTDFSATDAALERLRPMEMDEKEKLRRERTGFWKGMAQAAMGASGDEGIGTFLMRLGGAALGGRMSAKEDIEKEQDEYEDKLAKFNVAVYQNDMGKAQTHRTEMEQQARRLDDYNLKNWATAYERWAQNGQPKLVGNNVVVERVDESGQGKMSIVPVQSAVMSTYFTQKAEVQSTIAGRQMAGAQQPASIVNGLIGRLAVDELMSTQGGNDGAKDVAAAAAPAAYANHIVRTGRLEDLFESVQKGTGAEAADSLRKTVAEQLTKEGVALGSKEYTDLFNIRVAEQLAMGALKDPSFMEKMVQVGATLGTNQALAALEDARTTTSTNAKGQRSTRTSMPFVGELEDGDPWSPSKLQSGYGYGRF